jgi:hypothetical protein
MDDQSRNLAADDSRDFRSFAVEAFVGRRASGWPFARFDISRSELRVRLSFPWFTTRSQQASAIRAVVVARRFGNRWWLRFDDDGGSIGDVHVYPIYRRERDWLTSARQPKLDAAIRSATSAYPAPGDVAEETKSIIACLAGPCFQLASGRV